MGDRVFIARQDTLEGVRGNTDGEILPALWIAEYKLHGENSYVFRDADVLARMYRSTAAVNDPQINGEALEFVLTHPGAASLSDWLARFSDARAAGQDLFTGLETAAEMGYAGQRAPKKFCIFIENMDYKDPNQFGYDIIAGFREMAGSDGWMVDVSPLDEAYQRTTTYQEAMAQGGWTGAFLLGFSLLDPWMEELHTARIPTVLYDNYIKENPFMASISCDSGGGLEAAVRYLRSLGHRRIALLSGPLDSYVIRERYNAYCAALEKCGLPVDQELIGLGYYVAETTRKFLPEFIGKGATAILCSDDGRAVSVYTECCDRRLSIPQDVSIIGFDDLPMAAYMNPPLTTIRQDRLALGKCGYYALSCLINDLAIDSIRLRAPLVVRGSAGPAPQRAGLGQAGEEET